MKPDSIQFIHFLSLITVLSCMFWITRWSRGSGRTTHRKNHRGWGSPERSQMAMERCDACVYRIMR